MSEKTAFVPVGSKPMSAEYGETLWGVHKSTGIPYKHPPNVVDITCLLCEETAGKPLEVTNGEMVVTFPVCGHCRGHLQGYEELPDEIEELMFERLIARRIVDDQIEPKPTESAATPDPV